MPTPVEYARELVTRLRSCLAEAPRVSGALAELGSTLSGVPTAALPSVDEALRSLSFRYGDGWDDLTPAEVARFAAVPDGAGWAFVSVVASHPSGFVRQAALRALGRAREGRGLPFIVLRLNDWVAEVRQAAQAALACYLSPGFASALVAALPLVFALQRQRRSDHGPIVAWVLNLLRTPPCREALAAGRRSDDREIRRLCHRLASETSDADQTVILEETLADPDPAIRVEAVRRAGRTLADPRARELAARVLRDRSVQVRRVALQYLAGALEPEDVRGLTEAALLDENSSARWQARILRLQHGPIDLAEFYRRAVSSAPTRARLRGALIGLGESGTKDDIARVVPHLQADETSVRRAALRALAGLEPSSTTEVFLSALTDDRPGVSREGRRALEPRLGHVPFQRLEAVVQPVEMPAHVRQNALSLASHLSKWESLPLLLEGAGSTDRAVAGRGGMLLDGWCRRYNRSFVVPTHQQMDRIEEVLRRMAERLRPGDRAEVQHIVRHARTFAR